MGVLSAIRTWTADDESTDDRTDANRRARCRNCGQYYTLAAELCPHCGSGNKLRSGPPTGQTSR